jgi:hypothetical protein
LQISAVVAFLDHRILEDERQARQLGMRQHAPERGGADVAFADLLVAIGARAERGLRIVGVDQLHVLHAEDAVGVPDGLLESGFGADLEAGGQQMAGVEAVADGQGRHAARQIADRAQLLEARADQAAAAGRAFEQQPEMADCEAIRCFGQAVNEVHDAFLDALPAVGAGVGDQVLGADRGGALELAAEGENRFRADRRVDRREVDKIVVVNH